MSNIDQQNSNDPHNRRGMTVFIFSMTFVFSFIIYLAVFHKGIDLGQNEVDPKAAAAAGAGPVFDISTVKEPWVSTQEIVTYGNKIFKTNCAICHGPEGKGDGPSAGGMNPKPRNLVEGAWTQGNNLTDHFNVITNGIKGGSMAAFGHFKPADRWALVNYIESITQNKSKQDAAAVAEFAKTAK